MTDKEKIRNIIELFIAWNGETEVIDIANLDSAVDFIIDSLQEEPVSIWHDSSEEPNDKSSCLIHYIVGGEVSYRDIFPVIYNKKVREFVSESYPHPTRYKVKQSSLEGGVVAEVYKNMRDRFPLSDIYKWAYIDDILNLSNVQRTVKDWKEPVSDECIYNRTLEEKQRSCKFCSAACQVRIKEPVSEGLEEEIGRYFKENGNKWAYIDVARHFANWQKQQDQETIELAEDHAMLAGMEKMKEQMMAKAVDGDITFDYYGDGDKTYGCIAHNSFCLEDFGLKDKDKVKVIVIKED